ncbi:hypothetical protein [Granulosicoccus antarcticus]|uniref:Uncharacterized protein n=1 Tax=Granulosicoccus antarcticus IMCC3135 TaxID=1192854 RepID=A0A2Z2NRQ8_9GAMM|nr:hypothetical protein [Granulosicoccus antarcticus]ASJ70227.1 hypothetical protein IMCC3135_00505 [Granulosicoccus antarcticus IMCC3135]
MKTAAARQACRNLSVCVLLSVSTYGGQSLAQDGDVEWPCIQRLVPEISAAVMWPLPIEESMHGLWKSDTVIRPLAERLGDMPAYTEAEEETVRAFAQGVPDPQKEERLSLLAAGILDVTNGLRQQYIRGIKRYTRQQIAIAGQIGETLNGISSLEESSEGEPESAPDAQREELLATLKWHERVYDQREHAIRSLCDQPVELEETLSDVLRDLAQYLP